MPNIGMKEAEKVARVLCDWANDKGLTMMAGFSKDGKTQITNNFHYATEMCALLKVEAVVEMVPLKKGKKWVEEKMVVLKKDLDAHLKGVSERKAEEAKAEAEKLAKKAKGKKS